MKVQNRLPSVLLVRSTEITGREPLAEKPETVFQKRVQAWLHEKKIKFIKIQQVARIADPDIVLNLNGRYVELELKATEKSRVDKLQKYQLIRTNRGNGYGFLVFPENWEIVKEFLEKLMDINFYRIEEPECLKLKMKS